LSKSFVDACGNQYFAKTHMSVYSKTIITDEQGGGLLAWYIKCVNLSKRLETTYVLRNPILIV
jgi:hypothetical protein